MDDADTLYSLSIQEQTGYIAVSDKSTVHVYEPFGRDYGDLRWTRTRTLPKESHASITYLSWGSLDELLVAAQCLTLWSFADDDQPEAIWSSELSSPLEIALFSPDAGLVASCGQQDRIVKIWRRLSYEQDSTRFDVSYLPHPTTVTNLSWRKVWHQEQSLDNLLYSHCADNQVRVWTNSEPHGICALQKIVTIDTNVSIQPRRLSMGSISKSRFSFVLGSRDLARAAERAVQVYRNGTDHALEHLIEVANRSPEICIILDGLGHMSAWGIENAGLKNKLMPEKFNVALVDGVAINLPSQSEFHDFAQICAFANNDLSASLCILVHSYSGQIDWYQGSFVEFFDTAARTKRIHLQSCWSGHDSAVDYMVSSFDHRSFLSSTYADHMISWSQSQAGTLLRRSEAQTKMKILDVALLRGSTYAVTLHSDVLGVWDLGSAKARLVSRSELLHKQPKFVHGIRCSVDQGSIQFAVFFEDNDIECYGFSIASKNSKPQSNGYYTSIRRLKKFTMPRRVVKGRSRFCTGSIHNGKDYGIFSCSDNGLVELFQFDVEQAANSPSPLLSLATSLSISDTVSILGERFCAIVHTDRYTISIWNLKQGSCEFVHRFEHFDEIQCVHWYAMQDCFSLLAVQFAYFVVVLAQQRYSDNKERPAWVLQQVIQTRTHSSNIIGAFCWLEPHSVVLGLGNQIITFDIDIAIQDKEHTRSETSDRQYQNQLLFQNSSLSIFSPEILARLFQTGYYAMVTKILSTLHQELKFLSDDEDIHIDAGSIVLNGFTTDDDLKPLTDKEVFTNSHQHSDFDLGEARARIEQGISRISQTQLSAAQKQDLQHTIGVFVQIEQNQRSMDNFALIYLYHFLSAMNQIDDAGQDLEPLSYSAIVQASLSQTQESLLHFIFAYMEERDIKLTWANSRSLGLFLFISNEEVLRVHFESVARAEYNRNSEDRNPVDCSLYYLALGKKAILQSLWRRTLGIKEKESTMKLLAHDFRDPKWKATAQKNAYALLSKRRFEYAAAFFLLGGSLADAVNVCVNQIHDIQLAIAITRVWTGSESQQANVMQTLVDKTILYSAVNSHEARWMAIWGCVHSREWVEAIQYIVDPIDHLFEMEFKARKNVESDEQRRKNLPFPAMDFRSNEPTLLLSLYKHLRSTLFKEGLWTTEVVTSVQEWTFVMRCVNWYMRAGLDWLAIPLVAQWQFVEWQTVKPTSVSVSTSNTADIQTTEQKSALDEWLVSENTGKSEPQANTEKPKAKPPPTQFVEPSADSLLDSFGF